MNWRKQLRKNILLILTILSVFIGIGLGFALRPANLSGKAINVVGFPGDLFMNILKMVIIPLIAASLISGKGFLHIQKKEG